MKDAFGCELIKGARVIYASRTGSSLYLHRGEVIEAREDFVKVNLTASTHYSAVPRTAHVRTPSNIVVER